MRTQASRALYRRASQVLVGGVDSPVRPCKAVGEIPLFIKRSKGLRIVDENGNSYIDYVCSWGALILGSAHPKVVRTHIPDGTSYGATTRLEAELTELITDAIPSIRKKGFYDRLEHASAHLENGFRKAAESEATKIQVNRIGSLPGLFFTDRGVVDYSSAKSSSTEEFRAFFHSMLENGTYLPPPPFETIFVSAAHTDNEISRTVDAAKLAFKKTRMVAA